MSRSVLRRTLVAAVSSSVIAVGVSAVPASAQTTHQNGLVNVALRSTVPRYFPEAPATLTVAVSLAGVHDGKLNEPILVCQLSPVVA